MSDESVFRVRNMAKPIGGFVTRVLSQLGENVLAVVLMAILIAIATGAIYGVRWIEAVAIPNHDRRIQEGYERITDKFTAAIVQIRSDNARDVRAVTTEFTKDRERDRELLRELRDMIREARARDQGQAKVANRPIG